MTDAVLPDAVLPDAAPVVVGAGLAGLMTALHLAPQPCVVLTAGRLGDHAASGWAQGGVAAALGRDDSPALHAEDTLAAGTGLCDPEVVARVTAAAPAAVEHLAALGSRLDRDCAGRIRLGLEGAHRRHRIVHARGDGSGQEILRTAIAAAHLTPSITVLEHTRVHHLLVEDGRVRGLAVDRAGTPLLLAADRVVLATGGSGGLHQHTTNPRGALGQGLAIAARAGAVLRDLEMVQFHPTALDVGLDPMPLVSEAVRGEGAVLVDDRGERVLADDLATRDVVSRAVWARTRAGRRVLLDARRRPGRRFPDLFPGIASTCRGAGLDPTREPLPVRPAAHYQMGGVAVDLAGRSSVPGLWACGEVASTGLHGANRLASNSLLEALVCSRWVADDLAGQPATGPGRGRAPVTIAGSVGSGTDAAEVAVVRTIMAAAAGVLRDGATLRRAVDTLRARGGEGDESAPGDAALVALLVCWSALCRTESRGAHSRTDGPDRPDAIPPRHLLVRLTDAWYAHPPVWVPAGGPTIGRSA